MPNKLTVEQQAVVSAIVDEGKNVVVNAVAGSGKTFTSLEVFRAFKKKKPNCKTLLLTYSRNLVEDMKEKQKNDLNMLELNINTFHGFAKEMFEKTIANDTDMLRAICSWKGRMNFKYQLIILDEMQDANQIHLKLIALLQKCSDMSNQWLVLGDVHQSIFNDMNNSDGRFLTYFPQIIDDPQPWVELNLSRSFRLTKPMVHFMNTAIHRQEFCGSLPIALSSDKSGADVEIWRGSYDFIIKKIIDSVAKEKDVTNVMVLSSALQDDTFPFPKILSTYLLNENIDIHFPNRNIQEFVNMEILRGKMEFSSFHSAKGRESDVIFILDFCHSWRIEKYENFIPNHFYVALTRARKKLILCCPTELGKNSNVLPAFVKKDQLHQAQVINESELVYGEIPPPSPMYLSSSVTGFTKYLDSTMLWGEIEGWIEEITNKKQSRFSEKIVPIPCIVKNSKGLSNDVAIINSDWFTYDLHKTLHPTGTMMLNTNFDKKFSSSLPSFMRSKMREHIQKIIDGVVTPSHRIGKELWKINFMRCQQDLEHSNLKQVDQYDWLGNDDGITNEVWKIRKRLWEEIQGESQKTSGKCPIFEQKVSIPAKDFTQMIYDLTQVNIKSKGLKGKIDLVINDDTIYELKCTHQISREHILQSIMYLFIINNQGKIWNKKNWDKQAQVIDMEKIKKVILFNMRSGEKMVFNNIPELIEKISIAVIKAKVKRFETGNKMSDSEFITKNKSEVVSLLKNCLL